MRDGILRVLLHIQQALKVFSGRFSCRLAASFIELYEVHVLITRQHRAEVFSKRISFALA